MICRERRTHLNPAFPTAPVSPKEKKKAIKPLGCALDTSKKRKRMLQQPHGRLNTHWIPEFCQDATCFFHLIEEHIHRYIKKSVTNFRKPLEVGPKLAITLGHLASGETYTSLQICPPDLPKPSLLNSRTNICTALLALMSGKGWRSSELDGMYPTLLGP